MTTYRINNWNESFENNRTRELKNMMWVPIPNQMDGDGYTQVFEQENGLEIFAVWVLCVEVASKCDPRGTLLRGSKKPHNFDSLARITRATIKSFEKAIPFLVQIGWMEELTDNLAPSCNNPAPPCTEGKGMEGKGMEGKEWKGNTAFNKFWNLYPKKKGKIKALESFKKHKCDKIIDKVLRAIGEQILSEQWLGDNGKYIPHPTTWLNRGGWDDVVDNNQNKRLDNPDRFASPSRQ